MNNPFSIIMNIFCFLSLFRRLLTLQKRKKIMFCEIILSEKLQDKKMPYHCYLPGNKLAADKKENCSKCDMVHKGRHRLKFNLSRNFLLCNSSNKSPLLINKYCQITPPHLLPPPFFGTTQEWWRGVIRSVRTHWWLSKDVNIQI